MSCAAAPLANPGFEEGVDSWEVSLSGTGGLAFANVNTSTIGHNNGSSIMLTLNINEASASQPDQASSSPSPSAVTVYKRDVGTGTDPTVALSQTIDTCPGLSYSLSYCEFIIHGS